MTLAISTTLHTSFDDAVARTRKALADQGFGVLTEIDVKATLKAKLDEDMEDYLILGACNPPLAHRAIGVDREIGLLLPCNVVVRADRSDPGSIVIDAMDPQIMVQVADAPGLQDVADEAADKLRAAIDALAAADAS
ncbi:ABC transporter [Mycobacterium sp. ITM-2017-0098]|nr:ABC transporter [Mycobacterium sp. ITM-2017-0098]